MDKASKIFKEWILPYGLIVVGVWLFVRFVAFFTVVPTGSMIPTVDEHSLIISTRVYNPEKNVKRGDIIVFQNDELNRILFKRCIGLPGDHVVLDNEGKLYINGEYTEEPYVVNTLEEPAEFDVPEGCFLFLGDNRSGSFDARYWEESYIPAENVQGQARFTLWPLANFGPLH